MAPRDVNSGTDPFDLEPDDAPRRPPTTVAIGPDQRRWRRGGLAALGLLAAIGTVTVATRDRRSLEGAVPATSSTTTTRPRPSTTTTSPPTTIGPLLGAPTGLTLVLQGDRGIDALDVDTGALTEVVPAAPNGPQLVATQQPPGVVVTSGAGANFHPAPLDGPSTPVGPVDWVMASADPGRVWLVRQADDRTVAVEVTVDGNPTGPPVDIPGNTYPIAAVTGGLVVEAFGRLYVISGEDVRPVASGVLIAAGGRWLATQSCDDQLDCGMHVLDLVTGRDTPLKIPGGGARYGYPSGSFSPDGTTLALWIYSEAGARLVFIDLATSRLEEPAAPADQLQGSGQMAWSPSGEWIFWADGRLRAFHHGGEGGYVALPLPGAGGYYSVLAF